MLLFAAINSRLASLVDAFSIAIATASISPNVSFLPIIVSNAFFVLLLML